MEGWIHDGKSDEWMNVGCMEEVMKDRWTDVLLD